MRCIYQAENIIDAHLVLHRLQDAGIEAQVLGQYLTGAIGELPTGGLVRVVVADDDVEAALLALQADTTPAIDQPGLDPLIQPA